MNYTNIFGSKTLALVSLSAIMTFILILTLIVAVLPMFAVSFVVPRSGGLDRRNR